MYHVTGVNQVNRSGLYPFEVILLKSRFHRRFRQTEDAAQKMVVSYVMQIVQSTR